MNREEIKVISSVDGTEQPSLFYRASGENRPLIVGLHTWSFNRENQIGNLLPIAEEWDFNLLLPEFRGPNTKGNPNGTLACGSPTAKADIKDAIDYVVANERIDKENIFLVGLSGGGHMALLMAGFIPEYFRAIAAFVPISDLAKWREENPSYAPSIDYCTGGGTHELALRSPISYIDTAAKANLKLFHGKYDSCVPAKQSIEFYTRLTEKYPTSRVFLDIFDGGHQFVPALFKTWITSQYKKTEVKTVTG